MGSTAMSSLRGLNPLRHLLPLLPLLLFSTGCSDFERAAYRTLAVTQAEYEAVQSHVAEAAAHGLITEQQWNRFAAEGHRFIDAHNAAVDAFELWSRVKNPANEARVQALLEILPRLVRELNSLAESFESEPPVPPESEPRASASGPVRSARHSALGTVLPSEPRPQGSGGFSQSNGQPPLAYARGSD